MTSAIIAYGASVELSANGTTGWAEIPEITGIPVPATETDYVDVTSLDSPNGYREYIPGLKDAGNLTIPANYTHNGYQTLVAYQNSGDLAHFRVTLAPAPDQSAGDVFTFAGYITVAVDAGDVGGKVSMSINVRISGDVTWAEGAAVV